jgi:hypothetical protein
MKEITIQRKNEKKTLVKNGHNISLQNPTPLISPPILASQ